MNNNSRVTDGDEHPRTADSGQRATDRQAEALLGTDGVGGARILITHIEKYESVFEIRKRKQTQNVPSGLQIDRYRFYILCVQYIHTDRATYLACVCECT